MGNVMDTARGEEDIMEEMTTGTTELTERAVKAAMEAADAQAEFGGAAAAERAGEAAGGGADLLFVDPGWARRFLDERGITWQALIVTLCAVAVPACLFAASFWGRVFGARREEARGLVDRARSGFSEISDEGGGKKNSVGTDKKPGGSEFSERNAAVAPTKEDKMSGAASGGGPKMTAKSDDDAAEGKVAAGAAAPNPNKADADDEESGAGDSNAAIRGELGDFSDGEDTEEAELAEDLEAAPLHLHTLRVPARLRGASTPVGVRSRSSSRSRSGSRDVSPSPMAKGGGEKHKRSGSATGSDAVPSLVQGESNAPSGTGSSSSSVSEIIDPDILLDRAGFEELEPPPPHEIAMGPLASQPSPHGSGLLPSVNERMSEESLDDCHAFSDVVAALHSSLKNLKENRDAEGSVDGLLETLAENEEEDEEGSIDLDLDLDDKDKGAAQKAKAKADHPQKQEQKGKAVAEVAA